MTSPHTTIAVIFVFSVSFCPPAVSYDYSGSFRFNPKDIADFAGSDSYEDEKSPLQIFVEGRGLININDDWCFNSDSPKYFINYKQCGIYHKCRESGKDFVLLTSRCPGSKSFNETSQSCVDDPPCSKVIHPDNQGDYPCKKDFDHRAYDPTYCSNYYVCHHTGSYYTLEYKTCPQPGYFVEGEGTCSKDEMYRDACLQHWTPDLDGWCNKKPGYQQSPDTCKQYYKCIGSYVARWTCPFGEIYNNNSVTPGCIPGSCPEKQLPLGWECESNNLPNLYPRECRKFYRCHVCSGDSSGQPCYEYVQTCPVGKFFDETSRQCITATKCPHNRPLLPTNWTCAEERVKYVHPNNCSNFYTCKYYGDELTYEEVECDPGHFFDNRMKTCVRISVCPQDITMLPSGWKCSKDGEQRQVPNICSRYYTCVYVAHWSPKWGHKVTKCQDNTYFDEVTGECGDKVCPQEYSKLPFDLACQRDGAVTLYRRGAGDCSEYLKCKKLKGRYAVKRTKCARGSYFHQGKQACHPSKCTFYNTMSSEIDCVYDGQFLVSRYCNFAVLCEFCLGGRGNRAVSWCDNNNFYANAEDIGSSWDWSRCGWCHYRSFPCYGDGNQKNTCGGRKLAKTHRCYNKIPRYGRSGNFPEYFGMQTPIGDICKSNNQLIASPDDCTEFYVCIGSVQQWTVHPGKCEKGQYFSTEFKQCVEGECYQEGMYNDILTDSIEDYSYSNGSSSFGSGTNSKYSESDVWEHAGQYYDRY